jgi:chromosome segregation ATPase
MAMMLFSPEAYERLVNKLGRKEAHEFVETLEQALQTQDKKAEATIASIGDKADFLITQKKFELKDELTKELATKIDIVRLEGEIKTEVARLKGELKTEVASLEGEIKTVRQEIETVNQKIETVRQEIKTAKIELDRKNTIMSLILLFAIIFLNQNALEFIAKLLGLKF